MTLLTISLAVFISTFVGGAFAIYLKDRLHLILGFSAGAVIAVAFFDLIPESIELTKEVYSPATVLSFTALGFAIYMIIDRFFLLHNHKTQENGIYRGNVGAASLSLHSFLDGIGIGLAFQVSPAVGVVVAVAVLAHDFSDGINTVNMVIKYGGEKAKAFKWLFIDAIAPVLGIFSTYFFQVPQEQLGLLLGLFAGFFLFIGASDLVPESYHAHPVFWTTFTTVAGMLFLYVIINLAGG